MSTVNSTNNSSISLNNASTYTASQQKAATPSLTAAFASVSGTNNDPTKTNNGDSYLLDLSPSAQAYLQNYSGSASNSSTSSSNGAEIVLNRAQKQKLDAIIAKYKDEPYNDETFFKIQQDMADAGIGADALAAQSQMRALNPTLMLLNALNGGDGSVGTIGSSADIATQAMGLMKKVADQWKTISTTADDAATSTEA